MANQLYMPNFVQSFNQGYDRGQGQKFNRLVGLAQQDPDRRDALLGEAAQINPGAVAKLQGLQALVQQHRDQGQAALQKQQLTAQQAGQKRINGASGAMIAALKSGDAQRIQGTWQAVRPIVAQMSGKEPPEQFDPNMIPAIYAVNARTGGMDVGDTPAAVAAFNQFTHGLTPEQVQRAREIHLGLSPRASSAAIQYKEVMGPDGRKRIIAMNPDNIGAQVVGAGGAPQQGGFDAVIPGAGGGQVKFDFAPGTPPEVIQAAQAAAAANGDVPAGTFGTPTQSGGNVLTSPTEAQSAYNTTAAKNLAETEALRDRLPIEQQKEQNKANIAKQAKARGVHKSLISTTSQLDRLADAAKELRDDPGLNGIVGVEGHFPDYPGSEAAHARALLETLKSQIGFGVLQNMREMSPTGGALGQVSEKENELLQQNLAALGTNQSEADFKKSLNKVIQYAKDSQNRLRNAYQSTYGNAGGPSAQNQPPATSADAPRATNPQTGETVVWNGSAWVPEQ